MPSVASQAVAMQRTPEISAVGLGGSFSLSFSNFTGGFSGSGSTFNLNQSSEPHQKMICLLRIAKTTNIIFNSISLSISGYSGLQIGTIANSSNNLFAYFINSPRSSGASSSFSISINAPTNQSSANLTLSGRVYFLDGGSGPYDIKTGTNSTSHVLGAEDFINNKAAVFAISTDSSITGIINQASSPATTGAEIFTSGTTVNLSTSGLILSAAFK